MSGPVNHAVRTRTTIDPESWTPIVAPIACSTVVLYNFDNNSFEEATDDTNASTAVIVPAGGIVTLNGPAGRVRPYPAGYTARWNVGETVRWIRATSGLGPIIAEFLD